MSGPVAATPYGFPTRLKARLTARIVSADITRTVRPATDTDATPGTAAPRRVSGASPVGSVLGFLSTAAAGGVTFVAANSVRYACQRASACWLRATWSCFESAEATSRSAVWSAIAAEALAALCCT